MAAPGWKERRETVDGRAAFEKREKRRTIRHLQEAIDNYDVAAVEALLQKNGEFDVDFRYRGQTSLQLAVRLGAYDICFLLMLRGANVDEADVESNSLLNVAAFSGFAMVAKLLIDHGANLDFANEGGFTPLHSAAKKGHLEIVKLLAAAKCNLNAVDHAGRTPTMAAARAGHGAVVAELARTGADLNWMDQNHKTPLMVAAEKGHFHIVRTLISAGAFIDAQDRGGNTALLMATANNHEAIVKMLLECRANPDLCATIGTTPLLEAVGHQYMEIVQLLLDAGCNINLADRHHQTPLHEAIRQVSQYFDPAASEEVVGLVQRLVMCGANVNLRDNAGWTAVYQTAYGGHYELTKLLLEHGSDLTLLTKKKESVMHAAVFGNNKDIVNLLINAGCSLNISTDHGQTPLMMGIVSKTDIKILEMLVEAGADLSKPEFGNLNTPLHEAIHQHYTRAAVLLIDSGSNLQLENRERQSPLCMASLKGDDVITMKLLAVTPRPIIFTTLSAIPTHAAAREGHAHIINLLSMVGGCDLNQLNLDGLTPLQVAVTEDNFAAARRLLQLGCNPDAHSCIKQMQKCCITYEDRHPHLCLEPLFLAMTHRNLDLVRMLLQCYANIPHRVVRMLKAILNTSNELRVHYDRALKQELNEIFSLNINQPRSLLAISRSVIRTKMGFPLQVKIDELPLAQKLKDYILMSELFEDWDELDRQQEEQRGRQGVFGGAWRGPWQD